MNIFPNYIYIGIGVLISAYVVYKLLKKLVGLVSSSVDYIKKGDLSAQSNYDMQNREQNPLTKDEKIELSWQFLYDITDYVLSKFSPSDKEAVTKLGHKLLQFGATYEHVIEYGIKIFKKRTRSEMEAAKQNDSKGMSL